MNERVKAHGGFCVIKSEHGKGTTIASTFPLVKVRRGSRGPLELVGGMT